MSKEDFDILCDKIVRGVNLARKRLIAQRAKEDGELIFSDDNGKVIRIKAKDLLK